ncbi:Hcp family type VI secretion system effector [Gemmatimonas sp.]|jgi:type VI secretion system secreted protein Hcp
MAFDTFLFLDGVAGESTAVIDPKPQSLAGPPSEIYSFSWGASNPTTVGSTGGGLTAGKVSISSFNIMKKSDNASPVLFQYCCVGQHIKKGSVILRKATGTDGKQQTFIQYDFEDMMVESVQWSGSSGGDDTPTESISFAFAKVTVTNYKQDTKTGAMTKGTGASWDLTKVTA